MCILVVEDEFLIRLILAEELEDAGFQVKQANDGDEASRLLHSLQPPVSVLVRDIHMPGGRWGLDLAAEVHRQMPNVPVILTTGRPDALMNVKLAKGQYLIRKPYMPSEVIACIKRALAAV